MTENGTSFTVAFLKKGVPTMKQSAMVKLLSGCLLLAVSSMAQAQAGGDAGELEARSIAASSMSHAQAGGNAAAGKQKASMCAGCHDIEGYRTAFPKVYHVPRLRGQHGEYMLKSLEGYKNGSRSHPSMDAIAVTLTAQDMKDLVAHYTSGGR